MTTESHTVQTKWLAAVHVDHGSYHTVQQRHIVAPDRQTAMKTKLQPWEHLNGVSLVPADEYFRINL